MDVSTNEQTNKWTYEQKDDTLNARGIKSKYEQRINSFIAKFKFVYYYWVVYTYNCLSHCDWKPCKTYCENIFWSIKDSAKTYNTLKSKGFLASCLSTYIFSTLYIVCQNWPETFEYSMTFYSVFVNLRKKCALDCCTITNLNEINHNSTIA